ncbi:KAT8 regulatory NSL complex subunit 1-like protein isoform X2 [Coregonus clupeaformis]|uniref:KAT8 regulatory NSL complex subunit 1-like protein isoform X2 n=1 Tax=Coregonus clupeaformis TaxID=59861 RepID=UPI001E1C534D|nr:KAT8 regulatory NSL complex subunit 1-like protein isoform X2 [Coregonus clupeaformis]
MAPALTKLSKDAHGIHLATTLASSNMDANGAMLNIECDPKLKLMEDSYAQRVWLNLSSLPFLDTFCSGTSPLEFSESLLSPLLQASAGQYNTVLLSSPGSLCNLLFLNKNLKNSLAACPGAQDMYFVPVTEHNSQGVVQQQQCQHSGHGPDGYDIPQSTTKHCQGDRMSQDNPAVPTPAIARQGEGGSISTDTDTALAQPWARGNRSQGQEQPVTAMVEEAVSEQTRWHLSHQAALLGQAGRIQRRLQALLGDHIYRHCSLQLEGLKERQGRETLGPPSPPADTKPFDPAMGQRPTGTQSHRTQGPALLQTSSVPSPSKDIQEFASYAQAVLRTVQEAVDSDVTESSSDEELEPEQKWGTRSRPVHGCEWRWQKERAEVGSRWTWLQLRVAELEGLIQQLGDLHKQITFTKGGVVLAESQPLTDRQIQQTLLTETAGLSFRAGGSARDPPSDMENEPSSPTRLLRNIQRQSAQLSQIVNSLMPPLNLSPSSSPISKDSWRWKGQTKRAFSSGLLLGGYDPFSQKGPKRRRVNRRRQHFLQVDATCVSARTRPLVTYHKPRLFINTSHRQQDPASLSSSLCPTCVSCDSLALCSDPACSSGSTLTSRTSRFRTHPVLSLPSDSLLSHHLQNSALLREDWVQRPLLPVKTESSHVYYHQSYRDRGHTSPSGFSCSHSHMQHGRNRRGVARGVSPVRWAGSAQTPHRKAYRGGRKKRHTHRTIEDEEDLLSQLSDPENSPEESLEDAVTPQTSHTHKQGPIRRRQGESVYNIDNIVIPMALAATTKVEKLQYKDIITPSWRVVDNAPLEERERQEEEEEEELLCDETFSQRHLGCEKREKLCWTSWDKSRCYRRTTRSGSRNDGAGVSEWDCAVRGDTRGDTRGDMSTHVDWSCSHLDTDTDRALEEWVPRLPWDSRVFPLCEDEALRCHEEEQEEPRWEEREKADSTSSTDDSSSSVQSPPSSALSSALSLSSTTAPPAGYYENSTLTADSSHLK